MRNPIRETFELATRLNASDIHIHADQKPVLRVDGRLFPLTTEKVVSRELLDSTIDSILRDDQKAELQRNRQVDTSVEYEDLGVLRVNIFMERGKPAMANRIIGSKIPLLTELGLPPMVQKLSDIPRGMILVSGATSNGKSTTLAAIIDDINKKYQKHILTIEDPLEFIFQNRKSLISQRDIGIDAISFNKAVVGAMRQDPDVILISDLRDTETIENALIAAETGHLVFATTHAPTAPGYHYPDRRHLPLGKTAHDPGQDVTESSRRGRPTADSRQGWHRAGTGLRIYGDLRPHPGADAGPRQDPRHRHVAPGRTDHQGCHEFRCPPDPTGAGEQDRPGGCAGFRHQPHRHETAPLRPAYVIPGRLPMADRRLQVFATVARLLSFTKAAEALHMTQPAVTFQIRQLEEYFNTRLFDRTHNRITLTEAGELVKGYADRIIFALTTKWTTRSAP